MSSTTPNIGLVLPVGSERVSRQIINENNTKIDTAIGALNSKINNICSIFSTIITEDTAVQNNGIFMQVSVTPGFYIVTFVFSADEGVSGYMQGKYINKKTYIDYGRVIAIGNDKQAFATIPMFINNNSSLSLYNFNAATKTVYAGSKIVALKIG